MPGSHVVAWIEHEIHPQKVESYLAATLENAAQTASQTVKRCHLACQHTHRPSIHCHMMPIDEEKICHIVDECKSEPKGKLTPAQKVESSCHVALQ